MNLVVPMLLLICIISTVLPAVHAHVHNCVSHEVYKDFQEERVGQAYHSERLRSSRDYIRVLADTSLVTGSDALSCRSVGAYVRIGSPGTASPNPVCTTANGYIDCWHSCSEEDVLTPSKRDLIDDVLMGGAIDLIKSFLKVTPVQGNLVLSSGVCGANGGFAVPTTYTTTGAANTDLVLFVTARPTNGKLLAYALECRADQHGRPIAGQVNIAPAALEDSAQARNYIRVVLHEIVHVLGFTSWKYSSFVDPNTNLPLASVTKSATGPQGGAITQVVTPNALYHAQQFFGCSSLGGVSLEDGGSAASALSHWEKRIFRDDLMSPSMEDDVYISNTTLGFLADMGWYDVDYSVAEVSQWGLRQGCQFPTGKCTEWTQPYTSCSVASARTCSHSRRAVSYCAIANYDGDLPAEYQWFVNPRSGGLDEFVDYCPIYVPYSDYDCRGTNPFVTTNRIQRGAEVGPNSFCFESSLLNKSYTGDALQANCFNTQCQSGVLQVIIAGIPYNCPINGGDITSVTYFNGAITCPPADVVCGSSTLLPTPTPTISPTPPPATTPPTVAPSPTPTTVPTTKPPTNPPTTPTPTTPPTTIIPPTNPPTTPIPTTPPTTIIPPTTPPTTITPPTTPPPTTVPPTKPPTKQPTTPPTATPTATLQPTTPTTATAQPTTPPTKPASTTSATIATTSSTTAVGSTTTSSTTTTTGVDKTDVGIIMYLRTTKPCSLVDNSDLQKSISSYLGVALSQVQVTDCGLGGKEFTLAVSVVLHGNSSISGTVLGQRMENAMSNSVFASDLLSQEYELESVSYFNYTPTTTTTTSTTASSSTTSKPATTTSATSASTTTSSSSQGTNIQQQVADVFSGDNLIIIPCAIGGGLLVIAIIIIIVVKKKKKSGGGGGGKDQWY